MYYISWKGQDDRLGVYLFTQEEVEEIKKILEQIDVQDIKISNLKEQYE